ncbi:hypothetical protein JTE90_009136 [Oedothorax gibbosus]|uniref:BTB domain-containing protein n=1 Tax=Oedothorax gibbosus TaxID=931172 RepID=A0AAV6TVR5_9ARAC|nr:hypothetical protein JTE90_009136 [Oedothorax gibbosus]
MSIFLAPSYGYDRFYRIRNLKSYLMAVHGTLTVYCCILKKDTDIPMTVQCSGDTEIKVTKLLYTWVLKDVLTSNNLFFSNINRTVKIPNFSSEIPSFEIRFFVKPDSDDRFIHFAIESLVESRTFYLMYNIALLDSNGSKAHSVNGQSLFEKSTTKEIVEFAFLFMPKLLLDKQLYLHNGELTLQCEFSICTNDVENHIETIEYGSTKDLHLESEKEPEPFTSETDHWDQNTLQLYEEGKYSDFIIRSASRDFPVHKAILSAQSEVFSHAFEQDIKNQNTGVFEIKDFDDDTITKMLMFIYRNKLDELDYHCYLKLFSAADRSSLHCKVMTRSCDFVS